MNHLFCLILPVSTLLFLLTGPHSLAGIFVWVLPLCGILIADWFSPRLADTRSNLPNGYFDTLLYGLAVLQWSNIGLMLVLISQLTWESVDAIIISLMNLVVIRFWVGSSSCCSGIIVAHELIHRACQWQRFLGRLLWISVCYEHFIIAHIQSHHRNVAKPGDITTAQQDESFRTYWRRVVVEQFIFAWQLNKNQVILGLSIEFMLILAIFTSFGWVAAGMFVYQAYVAVRILEAVNYIQHWGLQSASTDKAIAWVSDNEFTQQVFLGLPLHIDHHKHMSKHYYQLSYSDAGPKIPYGYFIMNFWVKLDNASFRQRADRELKQWRDSLGVCVKTEQV